MAFIVSHKIIKLTENDLGEIAYKVYKDMHISVTKEGLKYRFFMPYDCTDIEIHGPFESLDDIRQLLESYFYIYY